MAESTQQRKFMLPLLDTYVSARQGAKCAKKISSYLSEPGGLCVFARVISSDFRTPKFNRKFQNTFG